MSQAEEKTAGATRHHEMHQAVAAMQVGDCLQWDIPDGLGRHAVSAAISLRCARHRSRRRVRVLFNGRRAFIVRIA